MAFAAEHPVLAHSEFRPVGEIERREKPFEVVSEFEPSGDQPKAIAELDERLNRGKKTSSSWVPPAPASRRRQRG